MTTMSKLQPAVELPKGSTTVAVSLINTVTFGPSDLKRFMAPHVPGLEKFDEVPSLCFLLVHPSGRKLVWDFGIRSDYQNYSPKIAAYIPTTKYQINVHGNLADIIEKEGVSREDVEAVLWSHWHWDHIGDITTFPSSTDLIVGRGFKEAMLPGAPLDPESPLQESDFRGRNVREITFDGPQSRRIGRFDAFDFFGDGSFFLLDSPGHAIGHMCGLVRTTINPDTFVLLGGDICHYSGIMRPSTLLPLPDSILPNPMHPSADVAFCPGHEFEDLQRSRGREKTDTLYDMTFGHDIPLATSTVGCLQELDCHDNVFVIIAHDAHVEKIVDHFPQTLNAWKQKDWGARARWAWLRDLESYWKGPETVQ